MSKVYGVTINDLHFGIRDSKRLYDELSQFKTFILDHPEVKIIVFAGDYYDHKLTLCEAESFYAMMFFKEVFDIACSKNIAIRMIQGTRSHELNQLELFRTYEIENIKGNSNFKIINTVSEETFEGLNILYIPEEYPVDAEEYYSEYRNKKHDIVFGHGTWDFVAQQGQIEHGSRKDVYSAPVFEWKQWKDNIDGFVSFGHIHGRNKYGKKIYYSGSFTRWGFGERSDRGFTSFWMDPDTKEYDVTFVDNTMAPKYDVMSALDLNLESLDAESIIKVIDEEAKRTDHLRVDFVNINEDKLLVIKNYYKENPKVRIDLRKKKTFLQESTDLKKFEKWHYITKKTLPLDKTIQKYCEDELKNKFTLEEINNAIKS